MATSRTVRIRVQEMNSKKALIQIRRRMQRMDRARRRNPVRANPNRQSLKNSSSSSSNTSCRRKVRAFWDKILNIHNEKHHISVCFRFLFVEFKQKIDCYTQLDLQIDSKENSLASIMSKFTWTDKMHLTGHYISFEWIIDGVYEYEISRNVRRRQGTNTRLCRLKNYMKKMRRVSSSCHKIISEIDITSS